MKKIPWEVAFKAERVIRILSNRRHDHKDGRLRSGPGFELQEIYFNYEKIGIKLGKKELLDLWMQAYGSQYALKQLEKKHSDLLKSQMNIARRIKGVREEIDQMNGVK